MEEEKLLQIPEKSLLIHSKIKTRHHSRSKHDKAASCFINTYILLMYTKWFIEVYSLHKITPRQRKKTISSYHCLFLKYKRLSPHYPTFFKRMSFTYEDEMDTRVVYHIFLNT
uniref:Uncharacterized protein n=1 Tax=Micrurus lemniscatus lemniscatus TaxID=129467 RepID=A0A2D4J5H5_MICLE